MFIKKMVEELCKYYVEWGLKVCYMYSEIDVIERNYIICFLRFKEFDILIGINFLREGLDLFEVFLVVIMDVDKEGFLRSEISFI